MLGTNVGQKAAQRVNIGCNEDKIWVFKPNPSQILSKDIIKTKVRHLLDIFWYWTKPGQKLGDLHRTPAPDTHYVHVRGEVITIFGLILLNGRSNKALPPYAILHATSFLRQRVIR